MAAYSTGCPALGRIVSKACDLNGPGIGSRQSTGRARDCGDHRVGRRERAEVDDTPADAEFDTGHAAPRCGPVVVLQGRESAAVGRRW